MNEKHVPEAVSAPAAHQERTEPTILPRVAAPTPHQTIQRKANDYARQFNAFAEQRGCNLPMDVIAELVQLFGDALYERVAAPTPETPSLIEMHRLNGLIDDAPDQNSYQMLLVALALTARQYLRERAGAVSHPQPDRGKIGEAMGLSENIIVLAHPVVSPRTEE